MKLLIFSVLLSLALTSEAAPRIIGGSDAPNNTYPYHVAIKLKDFYVCGGSILNKRWILTAAHCIFAPLEKEVVVGTNLLDGHSGQVYHVTESVIHEDYELFKATHDVGLLRVDRDIEFNNKVQPIALPKKNFVKINHNVTETGWGYTDYKQEGGEGIGTTPLRLQHTTLKTIGNNECKNYHLRAPVTDMHICTLTKKGHGLCEGDSGGPLVDGYVQIGIVSFGEPCALGFPDVYTNVYKYLHWIQETMRKFDDNENNITSYS